MKLRSVAIAVVLAAFSAVPWTFAQTQDPGQTQTPAPTRPPVQTQPQGQTQPPAQDPDKDQPKAADVENAPKQAPAALPTKDDDAI